MNVSTRSGWIYVVGIVLLLHAFTPASFAGAGDVDLSFDPGLGVNGPVNAVAIQPDGKVIIGGRFTTVRGFARTNLARLNADGSGDATFQPANDFNIVDALALLPNGQVLVGSQFITSACDESGCYEYGWSRLVRLDSNGAVDAGFTPAFVDVGSPYGYSALTLQPDGKILIGGYFTQINGTNRNGIARLNANGTLDPGFDPGAGIGGHQPWVYAIALESDGRMIVGGMFSFFNGTNRNGVARLNADGSLDAAFDPGAQLSGSYPRAHAVAVQPDGKILVGGYFTNSALNALARFNTDGSVDGSFQPETPMGEMASELDTAGVLSLRVQPDGRILVAGAAAHYYGCVDNSCSSSSSTNFLTRLHSDGSRDASFHISSPSPGGWTAVSKMELHPDGKLILGGTFTSVHGTNCSRVARLNADGRVDGGFDPGQGLEQGASTLALQPDGKVLMGGQLVVGQPYWTGVGDVLALVNGTNYSGRARLNANGSVDGSFSSLHQFYPNVTVMFNTGDCLGDPRYGCSQGAVTTATLVQSDGKVLVAGYVETTVTGDETFYQTYRSFLSRYSAAGVLDGSFNVLIGSGVSALAQQADGKIIVGGNLWLGGSNSSIARLHLDGTVDNSFQRGQTPESVACLALQPDGKVVTGGGRGLARLNADGSREACFNPVVSNGFVQALAIQPDGRLLIGGSFTSVNGVDRKRVARLNADGSLDGNFDPGTGADGTITSLLLQPDGNVLIGGSFFFVNGVTRPCVARLLGGGSVPQLRVLSTATNTLVLSWPVSSGTTLQQNEDFATPNWSEVLAAPVTVGAENRLGVSALTGQRFYRLIAQSAVAVTHLLPAPVAPQLTATSGNGRIDLSWTALPATGSSVL